MVISTPGKFKLMPKSLAHFTSQHWTATSKRKVFGSKLWVAGRRLEMWKLSLKVNWGQLNGLVKLLEYFLGKLEKKERFFD